MQEGGVKSPPVGLTKNETVPVGALVPGELPATVTTQLETSLKLSSIGMHETEVFVVIRITVSEKLAGFPRGYIVSPLYKPIIVWIPTTNGE
jgi:hypothetical protein